MGQQKEFVQSGKRKEVNVAACQYQFMTPELLQVQEDKARVELREMVSSFDDITRTRYLRVVDRLVSIAASQAVYGL